MKTKALQKFSKGLTLLIVLSCVAALAAAGQILFESSGISSFKLKQTEQGMRVIQRSSQDYQTYRRFTEEGGDELFLVSSAKTTEQYLDAEGISGSVSWSVRKGDRLQQVLWGKTETVTELNVHDSYPVLVSGQQGCCAEMTGYRLFNLETGRLLLSFNDFNYREKVTQPFSLEVPNSPMAIRYLGVLSQDSTRDRDFVDPTPGKQPALLIKYANEMLRQKLQVDMEVKETYAASVLEVRLEKDPAAPNSDKIEFRGDQVTLWNVDGTTEPAQVSGVLLKIVVDAGLGQKVIKIPVKNDRLDLNSAQIPEGVSIHPIVQLRVL
ncbi:hypothetical protein EZJ49_10325 [Bdellovibrio bacteriovorus]|uniref:hypothetical protein n=1 Tax=Bdellovibrio bacteriovorus TaxID=959 RepID=UPI0021D393D1|nr:hypothetical protein [Bdellovibrio bacteriovorus]UXR63471.1 hypothetical protein EZJ49_10325 [Bdellovibrio bacteriovorus]